MAPTLYHVPKTISSPIYQIVLELGLTDDEMHVEKLSFADLKSPAHLERNPMGTSPTLTDNQEDFAIWESGAILTYILTTFDTEHVLHPNPTTCSKADLAKFLHIQQLAIATVYPFLASLYIHTLQKLEDQDESYVNKAKETFRTKLGPVLSDFLGDSDYFMGKNNVSAIDYLVAKPLNNANSLGLLEDFPTLARLFQRIQCKESFATAYEVDVVDSCNCRGLRLVPAATETDNGSNNQESRNIEMR